MPKFLLFSFLFIVSFLLRAQAPEFKLNRTFGSPVFTPLDMAMDQENFLYVLERRVINKFDPAGNFIESINLFPENLDLTAVDLDVDKDGNFYVLLSRNLNPQVMKFSPEGKLLLQFGTSSPDGGPDQFWWAASLAVDAQGNILIADSDNGRIQKFNAKGEFLVGFKVPKVLNSVWENPYDLKVGKSGTIYYASGRPDLYKISPDGQKIEKTSFSLPLVYGGRVFLALDEEENVYFSYTEKIYKVSPSGQLLQTFDVVLPGATAGPVQFGIAVSRKNGDVYAVNKQSSPMIQIFAASGSLKKNIRHQESHVAITQDDLGSFFVLTHDPGDATQKYSIKRFNSLGMQTGRFGAASQGAEKLINPLTIAADLSGNIYCLDFPATGKAQIKKFDNEGKYMASFEDFGDLEDPAQANFKGLALDYQGNMYIADAGGACIRKISAAGKFIGRIGTRGDRSEWGKIFGLNGLTVDAKGNIYIADDGGNRIQKFSPDGQLVPEYRGNNTINQAPGGPFSLAVDAGGYLYVNDGPRRWINVFDPTGTRLLPDWFQLEKHGQAFGQFSLNRDGTRMLIAGGPAVWEYLSSDAAKESLISGKIYQDTNFNCIADPDEKPLAGILVKAEPGPYYGVSDEAGNYMIPVDTGSYTIQTLLPLDPVAGRTITPSCPANFPPVKVQSHRSVRQGPDFGHEVRTAPVLQVEVASNRRRRCFRNVTTVSYANTGFAAAPNAKVTVRLPEYVSFISANIPHTKDTKGNFLFAIGDLQPNQRGTISIIDSVSCADPSIRNLTVCTQAWITPVNAYPAPATWNRADVSVMGTTLADGQARFVIRNQGPGDMTDSLHFRVYQDMDLVLVNQYKLAVQDSLVLRFMPSGRAVRLEADQPQGHPLKATAGANVEKKARVAAALPALLMMAYLPDDPEPEIARDCQPIIDSFDPNDKQVVPTGLTAEHYTPTDSPLRYTVRFQNTGTDYAYRVVVVDTLSADLDLSTLQVGAVSHSYRLAITGKIRPVLTFTFNNIMLPDSARDQARSNGFIQFSIEPKAKLPEKARIENSADIFFDYNEPVRTNTTVNRIYDMPLEVKVEKQLSLREVITTPVITGFSPAQSRPGKVVTLKGRHFAPSPAGNKVTFNGVAATVVSATDSALTVLVPANAPSGRIKVLTPDGVAQSTSDYIIFQLPTLTAVAPAEAMPGTVITLTGTHFSAVAAQDTVTFNGVPARILEASETSLKVEVPSGAIQGKILVKTLGGQVESAGPFRVWYPPTITDFSPGKGKAGAVLTITGQQFSEEPARNQVLFGLALAQVLEASAGRLLVKVPAQAQSGKIQVQTPGGTAIAASDFTFIPAPEITAFTPTRANAGAAITLTGRYFNADGQADTVYFNALPAKILKATETLLEVQAPKGVESGTITVAGAGGKVIAAGFEVPDLLPEEAIDIYPNPTKAAITIDWFKADFTVECLRIYNAIGKLVMEKVADAALNDKLELSLSRFGSGMYLINIQTSSGPVVKRIMVL